MVVWHVKRPHGRALANERGHLFQTFSRQSEGLHETRQHLSIGTNSQYHHYLYTAFYYADCAKAAVQY